MQRSFFIIPAALLLLSATSTLHAQETDFKASRFPRVNVRFKPRATTAKFDSTAKRTPKAPVVRKAAGAGGGSMLQLPEEAAVHETVTGHAAHGHAPRRNAEQRNTVSSPAKKAPARHKSSSSRPSKTTTR